MVVGEVSLRTIAKESYGRWSRYINELFHECFDRHFSVGKKFIKANSDEQTLHHRMVELGREEPDGWCVKHIPICLNVQKEERHAKHINTVDRTPEEIVDIILRQ